MVESTALEMRHTRKGIGGSNPSLSASTHLSRIEEHEASPLQRAPILAVACFLAPVTGSPPCAWRRVSAGWTGRAPEPEKREPTAPRSTIVASST